MSGEISAFPGFLTPTPSVIFAPLSLVRGSLSFAAEGLNYVAYIASGQLSLGIADLLGV